MRSLIERLKKKEERGQILVIVAIAMVGLLAFAGLAVDTGMVLTRHAQLRRATDAAALGGVVELTDGTQTTADERAEQVFAANNIDISDVWHVVPSTDTCGDHECTFDPGGACSKDCRTVCGEGDTCMFTTLNPAHIPEKQAGANQYYVSSSWSVPVYFLQLVGFETIRISAEATAEHAPEALLYASSGVETGLVGTSNQSIFGPDLCTRFGDPYTPPVDGGGSPTSWYDELNGVYHFKIRVPDAYPEDVVRVEIYDPDSYNKPDGAVQICQENDVWRLGEIPPCDDPVDVADIGDIPGCGGGQKQPCTPAMDDIPGASGRSPNIEFYFYRIDENRGTGTVGQCGEPGSYRADYETITEYTLYYYERQADGSLVRHNLASYTSKRSDDGSGEAQCTDMHWVSPGTTFAINFPAPGCSGTVAADGGFAEVGNGNFEIAGFLDTDNPASEVHGIATDAVTGDRFIYLDVRGVSGFSENGFEFWAGPDLSVYPHVPGEVNDRNRWIVMRGVQLAHGSFGVVVFGVGHLPMNSNTGNPVDIPLMWVGPQLAGSTVEVRMFDPDSGSSGMPEFFFDTIPRSDWEAANVCGGFTVGDAWNDRWYPEDDPGWDAPCSFVVPSLDADGVPFYGGALLADYTAGAHDTYSWHITVQTRPYLVD